MRGVLFDKDGTLIDHKSTWVPLYRTAATELADGDAEHAERMLLLTGYDLYRTSAIPVHCWRSVQLISWCQHGGPI